MKCRNCSSSINAELIDLGSAPLSNAYLSPISMRRPEKWFPLRVLVCEVCWLVQAEAYSRAAEIFNDEYAYFSSVSAEWLKHSRRYFEEIVALLGLSSESQVVEVASNDGYLLQFFQTAGIPCFGIEPTASTAAAARSKGIRVVEDFFSFRLAQEIRQDSGMVDLLIANNVLAHVPDINDFLRGVQAILKQDGVATFEFPHLMNLVRGKQFDTIYHEHFSYLSLSTVVAIMKSNGLQVFRVEMYPTHGGSLRVFAQLLSPAERQIEDSVEHFLNEERMANICSLDFYAGFQEYAERVKDDFLTFLLESKARGDLVVGYGAAAKGNTLLNYAGVRRDLVRFIVDQSPAKQGKFMPGSRIPIVDETAIRTVKPNFIVVFPWNIFEEIEDQLAYTRSWGCKLVTAVPTLTVT